MTIAAGFFDGVHLGHRAILKGADEALTFVNHPLTVLAPERAPRLILGLEEKVREIGLPVMVLEFTPELAKMSAAEFADRFLRGRKVRCGANWRFGKGGEGDAEWLMANGYEVEVVPYAEYKGVPISSTRIRKAIERGEIEDANAMLGRPLKVNGTRIEGKGVGRKLGYPTINLRLGVYEVETAGEKGIANYGLAPTFGDRAWKEPVMEVHLLRYLREERRFDSPEALKKQIAEDIGRIG